MSKVKMTTEEAFIKVLQMHGIDNAFGIIGSAMMPVTDLFPKAGITFWDCGHEFSGGMMADGFTRASGKMSMMVGQNGPGIANFDNMHPAPLVAFSYPKQSLGRIATMGHAIIQLFHRNWLCTGK